MKDLITHHSNLSASIAATVTRHMCSAKKSMPSFLQESQLESHFTHPQTHTLKQSQTSLCKHCTYSQTAHGCTSYSCTRACQSNEIARHHCTYCTSHHSAHASTHHACLESTYILVCIAAGIILRMYLHQPAAACRPPYAAIMQPQLPHPPTQRQRRQQPRCTDHTASGPMDVCT